MMKEQIQKTRRERLRALVDQRGGPASVARRLGKHSAAYISQMCGPAPTRPVSEATARHVETVFGLPLGWLDAAGTDVVLPPDAGPGAQGLSSPETAAAIAKATPAVAPLHQSANRMGRDFPSHPSTAGVPSSISHELVREVTRSVLRYCESANVRIPPDKLADVVTVVYADATRNGAVQYELVTALVNLAK